MLFTIPRVWTHDGEPDRVHYLLASADGTTRHLWAPVDSALGRQLVTALPVPAPA
jgi:hypothetical protein